MNEHYQPLLFAAVSPPLVLAALVPLTVRNAPLAAVPPTTRAKRPATAPPSG